MKTYSSLSLAIDCILKTGLIATVVKIWFILSTVVKNLYSTGTQWFTGTKNKISYP
jgi:hypothetical protein